MQSSSSWLVWHIDIWLLCTDNANRLIRNTSSARHRLTAVAVVMLAMFKSEPWPSSSQYHNSSFKTNVLLILLYVQCMRMLMQEVNPKWISKLSELLESANPYIHTGLVILITVIWYNVNFLLACFLLSFSMFHTFIFCFSGPSCLEKRYK